ncbi:uncharacterized protein [Antedon mediterranea]|uniref:uncharacterized protein n=1 Tax=Antedon mediterranea TaxID=105859 RepID=UPI003AF50876
MKITLTSPKIDRLTNCITRILATPTPTIREIAQIIGYIVSSFPAVQYGKCHYRAVERDKINALKTARGNFDSKMCLSSSAIEDLQWWLINLPQCFNVIGHLAIDLTIYTDASLSGWGAAMGEAATGGHWTVNERKYHINYLELLAAYFGLTSFSKQVLGKQVKLMIDNTTAVSIINNMGTCHSDPCNDITRTIWAFCESNNIWITAAHIPGVLNVTADFESRRQNIDTEWMLNSKTLCEVLTKLNVLPTIDLFASRLNKQFDKYISYRQDPYATDIDAFTISWQNILFYCFPPFNCVLRVIQKIIQDKAQGILVVPDWPSQSWYPMLLGILKEATQIQPAPDPLVIPAQPGLTHPLHKKLRLLICHVSGEAYYLRDLPQAQ